MDFVNIYKYVTVKFIGSYNKNLKHMIYSQISSEYLSEREWTLDYGLNLLHTT